MIRFILPKKVIQEAVTVNNGASIKRLVHYHVDNTDALKSTHELAKNNPLLKKMWKNSAVNNSFQHPTIGRITCEEPSCSNKICKKVCSSEAERVYVGHVTHSNYPGSVYLSEKDFTGQNRPQYCIYYDKPVVNPDTQGNNTNTNQTNELNNTDAVTMVHIYSSKNPLDEII